MDCIQLLIVYIHLTYKCCVPRQLHKVPTISLNSVVTIHNILKNFFYFEISLLRYDYSPNHDFPLLCRNPQNISIQLPLA